MSVFLSLYLGCYLEGNVFISLKEGWVFLLKKKDHYKIGKYFRKRKNKGRNNLKAAFFPLQVD